MVITIHVRPYIFWNSIPSITNKQVRDDITHRLQLIRNMTMAPTGTFHCRPSDIKIQSYHLLHLMASTKYQSGLRRSQLKFFVARITNMLSLSHGENLFFYVIPYSNMMLVSVPISIQNNKMITNLSALK